MNSIRKIQTCLWLVCLISLFHATLAFAQNGVDTSNKLNVEILPGNGTSLKYIQTDSGAINKLIHNVHLKQGDTYMYCDSAYINVADNNLQAFGNVRIVQPGTTVESDYLRYVGNIKKAYLRGNVVLVDGKNNLWSEDLIYDVGTKIGIYTQGGTLQSDATTLSSNRGMYNARTKDARFTEEVLVVDPQYEVVSHDLGYNTATEVVKFYGPSIVTNDKSELRTSNGMWDAKNEIAHFYTRSSLQDNAQYIEADKMDYNRHTGYGIAKGNVICIDTVQTLTLYSEYAQYNEITKKLYATENPVMKKMNGDDSLFLRADTFFSAPIIEIDTLYNDTTFKKNIGKNAVEIKTSPVPAARDDTATPRYFIGYHHVLVYSDSLQAKCDSISYSQKDSIMRMMYEPIAWSRNSQITGDTILLYIDSGKLHKIYVPNNAFLVSLSGPPKAGLYDQVQGNTLTGYFKEGAIDEMIIKPNAEAIYYSKDDADAYLGVNEATSEKIKVNFANKKISKIVFIQEYKHKMTPMQQANFEAMRLSRFEWLEEERPKSLDALLNYKFEKEKDIIIKEKPEELIEEKPVRERPARARRKR